MFAALVERCAARAAHKPRSRTTPLRTCRAERVRDCEAFVETRFYFSTLRLQNCPIINEILHIFPLAAQRVEFRTVSFNDISIRTKEAGREMDHRTSQWHQLSGNVEGVLLRPTPGTTRRLSVPPPGLLPIFQLDGTAVEFATVLFWGCM